MKRTILAAAATALLAGTASAADVIVVPPAPPAAPVVVVEDDPGKVYISVFGGLLWLQDFERFDGDPPVYFGTDRGYRLGGAIGYQFSPAVGAELEVTFADAPVVEMLVPPSTVIPLTDDYEVDIGITTVMANVSLGMQFGALRPYVAVGAGAARISAWAVVPIDLVALDDVDWAFAVQALAGVDVALSDNLSLGLRYRFQHIRAGDFNYTPAAGSWPLTIGPFNSHGLEAVLTVRF